MTNDNTSTSDVKEDCDRKLFLSSDHVSSKQNLSFIFKKVNLNGLCDFLLDCNFDFCYTSTNINLIWSELKQIITSVFADFIPLWRKTY